MYTGRNITKAVKHERAKMALKKKEELIESKYHLNFSVFCGDILFVLSF